MKKSHNDNVAWGLILGFFGGVLINNIALGLVLGLLIGCFPKFIDTTSNKD